MLRILELVDKPIQVNLIKSTCSLSIGTSFQDIYDWAGKIRKGDIAKREHFLSV